MPKDQPLTHLKKINQKGGDYTNWAIDYIKKKLNRPFLDFAGAEYAITSMEENQRKLFIAKLDSALRSRANRKRNTSGLNNVKKSAFQVYISNDAIRKITNYTKTFSLTKSQYIEQLIDGQMLTKYQHKNKQTNIKNQTTTTPTEINPTVTALERELNKAQEEIKKLKEIISTLKANQQQAGAQTPSNSSEIQQSATIKLEAEEYFDLGNPKVPGKVEENIPRTYRFQRKDKHRNFKKLEKPSPT